MRNNNIEISKVKYEFLVTGYLIGGIGLGFLFGAKIGMSTDYILGGIFAVIGIILLLSSRFTK